MSRETRKLHPASDCFRGSGYSIAPQPLAIDSTGVRWGSFVKLHGVSGDCRSNERIYDGLGNQWTDVSAWYWSAATGTSRGSMVGSHDCQRDMTGCRASFLGSVEADARTVGVMPVSPRSTCWLRRMDSRWL